MSEAEVDMSAEAREERAETSAGRAGGYCWVEDEAGRLHCTLSPGHVPPHYEYYARKRFF